MSFRTLRTRDNSQSHQSRSDLPVPRCGRRLLAPQPLAQPPQLGKTNPGGGGGGAEGQGCRRSCSGCAASLGCAR